MSISNSPKQERQLCVHLRILESNGEATRKCQLGRYDGKPSEKDCEACLLYTGESRGFGDTVHNVLSKTGAAKLFGKINKQINGSRKPCKCGKRRAALNKLLPKKD